MPNNRRKLMEEEMGTSLDPNTGIYSGDQALRAQRGAGIDVLNQDRDVVIKGADGSNISKLGAPTTLGENELALAKQRLMVPMITSKFPKSAPGGEGYTNEEFLKYAQQNPDQGVDPRNFERLMNLLKGGGQ